MQFKRSRKDFIHSKIFILIYILKKILKGNSYYFITFFISLFYGVIRFGEWAVIYEEIPFKGTLFLLLLLSLSCFDNWHDRRSIFVFIITSSLLVRKKKEVFFSIKRRSWQVAIVDKSVLEFYRGFNKKSRSLERPNSVDTLTLTWGFVKIHGECKLTVMRTTRCPHKRALPGRIR